MPVVVTVEEPGERPVTFIDGVAQAPADMQLIVHPAVAAATAPAPAAPSMAVTILRSTFNGAVWVARSQAGSLVISAAAAYYCPAYAAMIVRAGFYPAFDAATAVGFSFLPQSGMMGMAARFAPAIINRYTRWALREHATQWAMLHGQQIMGAVGYAATQVITNGPTVLRITYNGVTGAPGALVTTGSAAVTAVGSVASGLAAATRAAASLTVSAATATYSAAASVVSSIAAGASRFRSWFSGRAAAQEVVPTTAVALITAPEPAQVEEVQIYVILPLAHTPDASFERSQHPSTRQMVLYRGPQADEVQQAQASSALRIVVLDDDGNEVEELELEPSTRRTGP